MRSFVFSVVLALLRPAASLDLVVKESMVCNDDLPISLNFTSLGDYANTLSFGRDDPVQGECESSHCLAALFVLKISRR